MILGFIVGLLTGTLLMYRAIEEKENNSETLNKIKKELDVSKTY